MIVQLASGNQMCQWDIPGPRSFNGIGTSTTGGFSILYWAYILKKYVKQIIKHTHKYIYIHTYIFLCIYIYIHLYLEFVCV